MAPYKDMGISLTEIDAKAFSRFSNIFKRRLYLLVTDLGVWV